MSTKIYNGSFIKTTSTKKLKSFIDKLSVALTKKRTEMIYDYIAKEFVRVYDGVTISETQKDKEIVIKSVFNIEEKDRDLSKKMDYSLTSFIDKVLSSRHTEITKTLRRDPSCDFNFEVAFIPFGNKVFTLPYYEKKEFGEIFFGFDEVEEYGYWNCTDKPDELTDKQWNKRRDDWDKALGNFAPSDVGFVWKFGRDRVWYFLDYWKGEEVWNKLLSHIPSFQERVDYYAKSIVLNKKTKELYDGASEDDKSGFSLYFKAVDYTKSDEGVEEVKKEKERLRTLLKQEFTIEDLKIEIKNLIA